jgi:hypothetical protein
MFAQAVDRTSRLTGAVTTARNQLTTIVDGVTVLVYVICFVLAVIGGVKVYQSMQANEQDAYKKCIGWLAAVLVLVIGVNFLRAVLL